MGNTDRQPAETLAEPLTRREREILLLLAQGLSGSEIAEKLTLALNSVKSQPAGLMTTATVPGRTASWQC